MLKAKLRGRSPDGADAPGTASGAAGSAAAGSVTQAAWKHPATGPLKHVMVLDSRGTKFSSLDADEVPMQEVSMDNLIPEERKTIILVVCISDNPVNGAPTRAGSWTRIDLAQPAEATDRVKVFHI